MRNIPILSLDENSFLTNSNSFFVSIRHDYEFLFASPIVFQVVWADCVGNVGIPMILKLWNTQSKYCRTCAMVKEGGPFFFTQYRPRGRIAGALLPPKSIIYWIKFTCDIMRREANLLFADSQTPILYIRSCI